MQATLRCIESAKNYAAARQARHEEAAQTAAVAPTVDIGAVVQSLSRAHEKGIRRPSLRMVGSAGEKLVFSRAPDSGRNAGSVYVNADKHGDYMGKITDGKFIKSRDCNEAMEQAIIAVCADPEQSAIAYGRQFGICSCCGRELTNALSVKLGIGPICRGKFF